MQHGTHQQHWAELNIEKNKLFKLKFIFGFTVDGKTWISSIEPSCLYAESSHEVMNKSSVAMATEKDPCLEREKGERCNKQLTRKISENFPEREKPNRKI